MLGLHSGTDDSNIQDIVGGYGWLASHKMRGNYGKGCRCKGGLLEEISTGLSGLFHGCKFGMNIYIKRHEKKPGDMPGFSEKTKTTKTYFSAVAAASVSAVRTSLINSPR